MPDLARRSLEGDAEIRIGTMHALENVGTDAVEALPSAPESLRAGQSQAYVGPRPK